mgnify:CR=1 FL=1
MSATTRAAAAVLRDIVMQQADLVIVLRAVAEPDVDSRGAIASAAAAMAAVIGMLADRAASAIDDDCVSASADEWLLALPTLGALRILEQRRAGLQVPPTVTPRKSDALRAQKGGM